MFSDINQHWAKDCIIRLRNLLIVNGYPDGTFRPNGFVSRAEYAVLMNSTFPQVPKTKPARSFQDVPTQHWAFSAIKTATEKGFLVGYPDGTFKPEQFIPRVQVLIALAAHLNFTVPEITTLTPDELLAKYFDDAGAIPTYAKPKLLEAFLGAIIVNYPDVRKLRPNENATRGEVAAILCRALNIWLPILETSVARLGGLAISPEFDHAENFADGLAWVSLGTQPQQALSTSGILVIPGQYQGVRSFSQGLAPATTGELWGYISKRGDFVIPPQFEDTLGFQEYFAAVKLNNQWGYIDRAGTLVIPPQFEDAGSFVQGLAAVRLNGKYGYINPAGTLVIPPQFKWVQDFSEGLAGVYLEQWQYIDTTGKVVISPTVDFILPFSHGLAGVGRKKNEYTYEYGYIDKTGTLVIPLQFQQVQSFSENLAAVAINGRWGYINLQGTLVIEPQFYNPEYYHDTLPAFPFSQGLARVRFGKESTFINPKGTVIIIDRFADGDSFAEGLARVNIGGQWITESRGYDSSAIPIDFVTNLAGGKWGYLRHPF